MAIMKCPLTTIQAATQAACPSQDILRSAGRRCASVSQEKGHLPGIFVCSGKDGGVQTRIWTAFIPGVQLGAPGKVHKGRNAALGVVCQIDPIPAEILHMHQNIAFQKSNSASDCDALLQDIVLRGEMEVCIASGVWAWLGGCIPLTSYYEQRVMFH